MSSYWVLDNINTFTELIDFWNNIWVEIILQRDKKLRGLGFHYLIIKLVLSLTHTLI